jgi:hypothetical protein
MDDFEVDDLLADYEKRSKKKRINCSVKGKSQERQLVKVFNERFQHIIEKHPDDGAWSRSVGSGNRWGQHVHLSKKASEIYSSDFVVPNWFRFTMESKSGYNDIDLCTAFDGGHTELDEFLQQVANDGIRSGRDPLLVWKKDYKPRVAFLKVPLPKKFVYRFHYREWTAISLEDLLSLQDDFFLNSSTS